MVNFFLKDHTFLVHLLFFKDFSGYIHTLYNVILRIVRNLLETRVIIPYLLHKKIWPNFMRMKQKKFFFCLWKKKFKMANSKKQFFNSANSQYFFTKILQIGPWVSRINWCKGHWCGSTYMVVRLSDIRSKTGKKCIFSVFCLC